MALMEELAPQPPPLRTEAGGVVRVGETRVSLDSVIGAFHQAAHFVVLGPARCQDHDRHPGPRRAQAPTDLHAVQPRQHEIEQHEIELIAQAGFHTCDAIGRCRDDVAVGGKQIGNAVPQARFVFDQEDAHATTFWHAAM